MSDDDRFEKNADEMVIAHPLAEIEVRASAIHQVLVLRLRYYPPGNEPPEPARGRLQLSLGPKSARVFAERLTAEADNVEARRGPPGLN